jgi:UDPglucose 6-dehydrogenase
MASRGLTVTGVDISQDKVVALNAGVAPVFEPGLAELIEANRPRLSATADLEQAVAATDATFIVVPTPSDECGAFSLASVEDAVRRTAHGLRAKPESHLVVLTSTVMPGDSDGRILPLLERECGRRLGHGLGYCYSPEFVALGSVIGDLLSPDFILVGANDAPSGTALAQLYGRLLPSPVSVLQMSCVNAELAKLAVNSYITMKISFANTLAQLCQRLPGGDVDAVTQAVGLDSRISPGYLQGALGFGGPCFPRDNVAFAQLADRLGVEPLLARATDAFNASHRHSVFQTVTAEVSAGARIAVLGLAYKPGTDVVTESQGLWLAQAFADAGYAVRVYDPLAVDASRLVLGEGVAYGRSLEDALAGADAVVIANADPAFRIIDGTYFAGRGEPVLIFDCWRLLQAELRGDARVHYRAVGLSRTNADSPREVAK